MCECSKKCEVNARNKRISFSKPKEFYLVARDGVFTVSQKLNHIIYKVFKFGYERPSTTRRRVAFKRHL